MWRLMRSHLPFDSLFNRSHLLFTPLSFCHSTRHFRIFWTWFPVASTWHVSRGWPSFKQNWLTSCGWVDHIHNAFDVTHTQGGSFEYIVEGVFLRTIINKVVEFTKFSYVTDSWQTLAGMIHSPSSLLLLILWCAWSCNEVSFSYYITSES